MNKVTLLGHLGKDPNYKSLPSGDPVASFSLATSYSVKVNDEWVDRTEWHNVSAYGRTAEIARDYLKKGSKLYVEGRLTTRSWDDRDTNKKMYRTEVIAIDLVLLSAREGSDEGRNSESDRGSADRRSPSAGRGRQATATYYDDYAGTTITDEDIPF